MTGHRILPVIRKTRVLLVLVLVGLASCNQSLVYEENREIPGKNWHKDSLVVFAPAIEDTSNVLNFGFSFEHNNDYPYSNLWLFIDVKGPEGHQQTDTMEFFLAEPDGRWLGKGNDDSRTVNWLYKRGVKMRQPGTYSFVVRQGMRRDRLDGVQSLSMWVEKINPETK